VKFISRIVCRIVAIIGIAFLLSPCCLVAQTDAATISGRISDPRGAFIRNAVIELVDIDRGTVALSKSNSDGVYSFPNVRPARYRVRVQSDGFKTVDITGLTVNTQDRLEENFALEIGSASESVTVEATSAQIDGSGAVRTVVDQGLVKELPLNGRSFQTLFQLTPSAVTTAPASGGEQGQFSVNGQRADANYVMVDGASANVGLVGGAAPQQSLSGSLPGLSVAGGTNTLVSTDAVQEFSIQTSSFAPEFGRTPGAQVSITTRSGTDQLHGTVFDYLRNDLLDANDWFANHNGLKRAALRQNDFGGVVGGPIVVPGLYAGRNRTFFFFSYEGLRVVEPNTGLSQVPSLSTRSSATPTMQAILNAFPMPTGPDLGTGLAPANYSYSNPLTIDASSLRIDHQVNSKLSVFGRVNHAPSSTQTRGSGGTSLSNVSQLSFSTDTVTAGSSYVMTPRLNNEFRFNWSRSTSNAGYALDTLGGAVPFTLSSQVSSYADPSVSNLLIDILTALNGGIELGPVANNSIEQLNLVDGVSWQIRTHVIKFGIDWRHVSSHIGTAQYLPTAYFDTASAAAAGNSLEAAVTTRRAVDADYNNYSIYAQDTFKVNERLNMTYGLRWDYNPSPSGGDSSGLGPILASGYSPSLTNLSSVTLHRSNGSGLYNTTADNVAPRLGMTLRLSEVGKRETVLRVGGGIFYDLGSAPTGNIFTFSPFTGQRIFLGTTYPLPPSQAANFDPTTTLPYTNVAAFPDTLRLPYVEQWNIGIEQNLSDNQTVTATYAGAGGHSLLRQSLATGNGLTTSASKLYYVDNESYSNYNSFQLQFRRRSTRGLQLLASYTYAHSLDNSSADSAINPPSAYSSPSIDYGNSDFDIRHTGSFGFDYRLPQFQSNAFWAPLLRNWAVGSFFEARTAPPVNVTYSKTISSGSYTYRPNVIAGVPLYIHDPTAPGGVRFNNRPQGANQIGPFAISSSLQQGNFGRNTLRGFPLVQFDMAVRREITLTDRVHLQARVEAFNLTNHPNFASQSGSLGTVSGTKLSPAAAFGSSQSSLAQALQGTFGVGFNSLYQLGGARSLQVALKVVF
jgi:hypothetical protein